MSYLSDILRGGQNVSSIANSLGPGALPVFGSGRWRIIATNQTVVIPPGISQIRVRTIGGGAGGQSSAPTGWAGAGGGYAHGVFTVAPGSSHVCAVGAGGAVGANGGSSSFGVLISATGGAGGASGLGGVGTGGDFQASGGNAVQALTLGFCPGGSAAGSQLGNGGVGGPGDTTTGGGGGAVGGLPGRQGGASPFGYSTATPYDGAPDPLGAQANVSSTATINSMAKMIRFPFDGFTGGGGPANNTTTRRGGPGCGGGGGDTTTVGGAGGDGGGGGGNNSASSTPAAGPGGIGGGGGCSRVGPGGLGGNGLIIMEY